MATPYQRHFWLGTILTTAVIGLSLHFWWKPRLQALPARIPFPLTTEVYPASYGKGIADHYLCYFGIFGVGDRLRKSDVLCIGTSHFMLGMSASDLSQRLTEFYGHEVNAYNMGLGFADMAFQAECLERLHVKNKTLLIDVFAPGQEGLSAWASTVKHSDIFGAYIQVGEIWLEMLRDWTFDPVLPRIYFQNGSFVIQRQLEGLVIRRWDHGDTEMWWYSQSGITFQRGVPPFPNQDLPMQKGEGRFEGHFHHGVGFPDALRIIAKQNSLKTILMLYPFEGYEPDIAKQISAETGFPLILVSPEGLRFRDTDHLNAASRDIGTDRVFDLSRQQGIDFLNTQDTGIKK